MIRIYTAQNSIEAQAIKFFLADQGILVHFEEPINMALGPMQIPIFISEKNNSPELEAKIQDYLKGLEETAKILENPTPKDGADTTTKPPESWTPIQAIWLWCQRRLLVS